MTQPSDKKEQERKDQDNIFTRQHDEDPEAKHRERKEQERKRQEHEGAWRGGPFVWREYLEKERVEREARYKHVVRDASRLEPCDRAVPVGAGWVRCVLTMDHPNNHIGFGSSATDVQSVQWCHDSTRETVVPALPEGVKLPENLTNEQRIALLATAGSAKSPPPPGPRDKSPGARDIA